MASQKEIPNKLERYELKYLIPESWIIPISEFLSIYCSLDEHSEETPDHFYMVYSLYLDSPSLTFLQQRINGAENRFNMRIRTYDIKKCLPCFFEIKQKRSGIIKKYRVKINDPDWPNYLVRNFPDEMSSQEIAALFYRLIQSYNASPKVFTQYRRKAYISGIDNYARATFDRDLQSCPQSEFRLSSDPYRMSPYDHERWFPPGANVILELKCYTTHVPLWMIDLIREFNLERTRFSKYVSSLTESHALNFFRLNDRWSTYSFF
ncbi:MAG: polyphosphate polymerase domain-containing protein [Candidatus Magnetomorum sp.]|nr:polyphosphate polymerase domain-containing protein [Candidatus Magnetomorum sp.]